MRTTTLLAIALLVCSFVGPLTAASQSTTAPPGSSQLDADDGKRDLGRDDEDLKKDDRPDKDDDGAQPDKGDKTNLKPLYKQLAQEEAKARHREGKLKRLEEIGRQKGDEKFLEKVRALRAKHAEQYQRTHDRLREKYGDTAYRRAIADLRASDQKKLGKKDKGKGKGDSKRPDADGDRGAGKPDMDRGGKAPDDNGKGKGKGKGGDSDDDALIRPDDRGNRDADRPRGSTDKDRGAGSATDSPKDKGRGAGKKGSGGERPGSSTGEEPVKETKGGGKDKPSKGGKPKKDKP